MVMETPTAGKSEKPVVGPVMEEGLGRADKEVGERTRVSSAHAERQIWSEGAPGPDYGGSKYMFEETCLRLNFPRKSKWRTACLS